MIEVVPGVPIRLISDWVGVAEVIGQFDHYSLYGIDTESIRVPIDRLAILQIAVVDVVWILDVPVLMGQLEGRQWLALFKRLFCSEATKLGFYMRMDLKLIANTFPYCVKEISAEARNFLCLSRAVLGRPMKGVPPLFTASPLSLELFEGKLPVGNSLQSLAKALLGIELDKDRSSRGSWKNRPFGYRQLHYAAMDAYCLLRCYRELMRRIASMGDPQNLSSHLPGFIQLPKTSRPLPAEQREKCRKRCDCSPLPSNSSLASLQELQPP